VDHEGLGVGSVDFTNLVCEQRRKVVDRQLREAVVVLSCHLMRRLAPALEVLGVALRMQHSSVPTALGCRALPCNDTVLRARCGAGGAVQYSR